MTKDRTLSSMTMNPLLAPLPATSTRGANSFGSPLALPAFLVMALNVVLVVSALAAAGYMSPLWAAVLLVGAVAFALASTVVIVAERRRIRRTTAGRASSRTDLGVL